MAIVVFSNVMGRIARSIWQTGAAFGACTRAAIAPMTALMMIPVIGGVAYAVELGSWQYMQRSAQNAADSAALAAATVNSGGGSSTAESEARAAAAKFGFVDGQNSATVDADVAACPATGVPAGSICYEAVLTTSLPLTFSRVLNFTGSGGGRQNIYARAVAIVNGGGGGLGPTNDVCVWTFTNLQTNGTPDANLSGCSVLSDGNMTCTGGGLHADFGVAGGTVSGSCAQSNTNQLSGQTNLPSDPYAAMAGSIPSNPCGTTYPQLDKGKVMNGKTEVTSNYISGSKSGEVKYCGDVKLTGNVTLTGNATKLVIYNGRLDLNRYTVKTAAGASATVIFSGTNGGDYQHYPVDFGNGNGSGILEIEAPTASGSAFKDVAIYTDPALTTGVDFTYAGNKPAWKITGVMYFPKATAIFSGIVDKADDGASCQILVGNNITINGTGKVVGDVSGCADAGIDPPEVTVGPGTTREKLVL